MKHAGVRLPLLLAMMALAGSAPLHAASDSELFRDVRFRFFEPGTRGVAMGGAFTAAVEDVSAAYYNPAGLHFLRAPEIYMEYRSASPESDSVDFRTGGVEVDPVDGPTDLPFLEVRNTSEAQSIEDLSFLGLAWPFKVGPGGRNLTVSVSGQLVYSTDRTLVGSESQFAFESFPNTVVGSEVQVYSVAAASSGDLQADVSYVSAGVSYDVTRDFSLGVTLSYAALDMAGESVTVVDDPLQLFVDPTHPRLSGQPAQDLYATSASSSDSDFAYTIGLHWHPDSIFSSGRSPWRFGLVWAKGARFSVREEVTLNDVPDASYESTFVVPDRYSIGIAYQTPLHWTFSFDYQRVEYSDLTDGFRAGVGYLNSSRLAAAAFQTDPDADIEYSVDDAGIPRFGAEFRNRFGGNPRRSLTVQLGYYRDDDVQLRLSGFNSVDPAVNEAFNASASGGGTSGHLTAGIGLVWGIFGFHLAGDLSDAGDQVLASLSFGLDRRATISGARP